MDARPRLPGLSRFFSLRDPALRIGFFTGVCLSGVFIAWLLIANRVPQLERFWLERNAAAAGAALILLAIPICRFLKSAAEMFVSGVVACAVASLCYFLMELHFPLLENHIGALHLFMLGALAYGFLAVLDWVISIFLVARRHPVVATRRRSF